MAKLGERFINLGKRFIIGGDEGHFWRNILLLTFICKIFYLFKIPRETLTIFYKLGERFYKLGGGRF